MVGIGALIEGGSGADVEDGAGVESDTWRMLPVGLSLAGLVIVNCPSTGNSDATVNKKATTIIRMSNDCISN